MMKDIDLCSWMHFYQSQMYHYHCSNKLDYYFKRETDFNIQFIFSNVWKKSMVRTIKHDRVNE